MAVLTALDQAPPTPRPLLTRSISASVRAALGDTPIVVLTGPRQAGKSTLAAALLREAERGTYLTLDDTTTLSAARSDPEGFIAGLAEPVVLDEVQRAPELFMAIKANVDRDRRPGRFLLTGSAAVLLLPTISESLAGRAEVLTLWPLSQGELIGRRESYVDRLFGTRLDSVHEPRELRADIVRRAVRGGFPEAIQRADPSRRAAWFRSYVNTILRDVRELANIEGLTEMPRLLALLAARSTALLNIAELARTAGIAHRTLIRYVALLENTFLIVRIPAWSGNLGRRLVRHPKVMLTDTGLLAHLQGVDEERFAADPSLAGSLFENFVAMELRKQIGWSRHAPSLYHYRSHAGEEVDFVLEHADGRIVGIEVKVTSRVGASDFNVLRRLQDSYGHKFHRGVVLYGGRQMVPFGARLHAVPLSALWKL